MENEQTLERAYKVTLSSGKVVMLREMKIKHQNLASQAIGKQVGDNMLLASSMMQQELLKVLLIEIDGKPLSGRDRENLDDLFSFSEYSQLAKVIAKLTGGDDSGECQTETVNIGKR